MQTQTTEQTQHQFINGSTPHDEPAQQQVTQQVTPQLRFTLNEAMLHVFVWGVLAGVVGFVLLIPFFEWVIKQGGMR